MENLPSNFTMWQTVVGVLLPIAIALINKPSWPSGLKYWIAFSASLLAAAGDLFWSGQFNLADLPGTFLKILFLCVGSYLVFWRPSGIGDLIERKFNGDKPGEPPARPYGKLAALLIAGAVVLASSGCATGRQTWLDMLGEQQKTVEAQIAQIPAICKVAMFDMGWVEGTRVLSQEDVSVGSQAAAKRLEMLCKPGAELTYRDMGWISATAFRLWADRVAAAFLKYAPMGGLALTGLPAGLPF